MPSEIIILYHKTGLCFPSKQKSCMKPRHLQLQYMTISCTLMSPALLKFKHFTHYDFCTSLTRLCTSLIIFKGNATETPLILLLSYKATIKFVLQLTHLYKCCMENHEHTRAVITYSMRLRVKPEDCMWLRKFVIFHTALIEVY